MIQNDVYEKIVSHVNMPIIAKCRNPELQAYFAWVDRIASKE